MEVFSRFVGKIKTEAKTVINSKLDFKMEFKIIEFFFKMLGEYLIMQSLYSKIKQSRNFNYRAEITFLLFEVLAFCLIIFN